MVEEVKNLSAGLPEAPEFRAPEAPYPAFREYPKLVHSLRQGIDLIVHSRQEEEAECAEPVLAHKQEVEPKAEPKPPADGDILAALNAPKPK